MTSMQAQFYRRGRAEAYSTEWRSQAATPRHLRQGEGPCFSHHHSGAPWLGARKLDRTLAAVALHCTQSQTMLNVRGSWQEGVALLRQVTYGTPPPIDTTWGAGQSEGGGAAHPRRGGGGLS